MKKMFDCCLIICHGKSELIFFGSIKSNLRLKFETYGEKNGRSSIQITGLKKLLNSRDFKTLSAFSKKYALNVKKKRIENFKVFIVMDFDEIEYTNEIKDNFLNKSMFKDHFLYDYIVPVYNIKNFDDVLIRAGFEIDNQYKTKSYSKIFPGENGDYKRFLEIKNNVFAIPKEYSNIGIVLEHLNNAYKEKGNK